MAKKKPVSHEPEAPAPKSRKAKVVRTKAQGAHAAPPAAKSAGKPKAKPKPKPKPSATKKLALQAPASDSARAAAGSPAARQKGAKPQARVPRPSARPAKQPAAPAPAPAKPRRTGPVSAAELLGSTVAAPTRVFEVPPPALVEGRWRRAHAALLKLRDRILDSMNTLAGSNLKRSHADETPSYGGMDEGDVGLESYDRDFALGLFSNGQDSLYEVEEALRRIVQGTYGDCESCGKSIPAVRLKAVPYARCCVDCQSQEERRQRTAAMVRRSAIAKERYSGQE